MEAAVNFTRFQEAMRDFFPAGGAPRYDAAVASRMPPLVLAYVGDAVFSLYVRVRLLAYEQDRVQVLHAYAARLVSAELQAAAVRQLDDVLSEEEKDVIRRGRNTAGHVPRHAKVADYRYATGWEALLGFLLLTGRQERVHELCGLAFDCLARRLAGEK